MNDNVDYELIQPALVLATKLISTPALLSFWHTVFFSDAKPTSLILHPEGPGHKAYEYCETNSELTEEQVENTQTALLAFRRYVFFSTRPPATNRPNDKGCMVTSYYEKAKMVHIEFLQNPVTKLELAADLTKRTGDPVHYALESFAFAKGIVHELAHAVTSITRGNGDFYFPCQAVNEDGFEWEHQVFGGIVEVVGKRESDTAEEPQASQPLENEALFVHWPCPQLVGRYIHAGHPIGFRLSDGRPPLMLQPEDTDDWAGLPFTPYDSSLVERMFTKRFWEQDVAERGVRAFQISAPLGDLLGIPGELAVPVVKLYARGEEMLGEALRAARAAGDDLECERLQVLQKHIDGFYRWWRRSSEAQRGLTRSEVVSRKGLRPRR